MVEKNNAMCQDLHSDWNSYPTSSMQWGGIRFVVPLPCVTLTLIMVLCVIIVGMSPFSAG